MALLTIDQAIAALSGLDGTKFEQAVCKLYVRGLKDFQPVPDTVGDGGLDGISDQKSTAYLCYGPTRETRAKPTRARREAYRKKFRSDLRKLYELQGKKKPKRTLCHKDNALLSEVLKHAPGKISRIRICLNEFTDKALIDIAEKEKTHCEQYSAFRFVDSQCSIQVWGPEEICCVASSHDHIFAPVLEEPTPKPPPSSEIDEFDDKFEYFSIRADRTRVEELKRRLKSAWAKALGHELSLRRTSPHVHSQLLHIRNLAETEALQSGPMFSEGAAPYAAFNTIKKLLTEHFSELLKPHGYTSVVIAEMASGEAARIVGVCHLDWR